MSDAPEKATAAPDAAPATSESEAPAAVTPESAAPVPAEPAAAEPAPAWTPPAADAQAPSGMAAAGAERPEIAVGAAFAGGFALALILKRLAR